MRIYFVDTSSLIKRYVQETDSNWIRNLLNPSSANLCIISELTLVEAISALEKSVRRGEISESIAGLFRFQFITHSRHEYLVVPISSIIMTTARKMLLKHHTYTLRTLDAIQLATAVHTKQVITQAITFVASDNRLLATAVYEGFPTDNPSLHP